MLKPTFAEDVHLNAQPATLLPNALLADKDSTSNSLPMELEQSADHHAQMEPLPTTKSVLDALRTDVLFATTPPPVPSAIKVSSSPDKALQPAASLPFQLARSSLLLVRSFHKDPSAQAASSFLQTAPPARHAQATSAPSSEISEETGSSDSTLTSHARTEPSSDSTKILITKHLLLLSEPLIH